MPVTTTTRTPNVFRVPVGVSSILDNRADGKRQWRVETTDPTQAWVLTYDGETGIGMMNKFVLADRVDIVSGRLGDANDFARMTAASGTVAMNGGDDRIELVRTTGFDVDGGTGTDSLLVDRRGTAGPERFSFTGVFGQGCLLARRLVERGHPHRGEPEPDDLAQHRVHDLLQPRGGGQARREVRE